MGKKAFPRQELTTTTSATKLRGNTMKFFFIGALFLLFTFQVHARRGDYPYINIYDFHYKNFNAVGGKRCGAHIEVSGSRLFFTNIVNPRDNYRAELACTTESRACRGATFMLNCNWRGDCFNREGHLVLVLLEDGNFVSVVSGTKFSRSYTDVYFTCR